MSVVEQPTLIADPVGGFGTTVPATYDGGAVRSFIRESALAKYLPTTRYMPFKDPVEFTLADGRNVPAKGAVILSIMVDGCPTPVPTIFHVMENLSSEVIIGAVDMEALGVVLEYDPVPGRSRAIARRGPPPGLRL